MKMLIQVCLLLLSVGVYASYADGLESTTEDELFAELQVFPENFLSKFPQEAEFFRTKILVYLVFNLFSKYFADNEPIKFWTKFNRNDFNRVAIDAAFYEYLTKFTDRKMKHLVFNPLDSSASSTEDIAIDRIGDYLDNLSTTDVPAGQPETRSQAAETVDYKPSGTVCAIIPLRDAAFGIPGTDFPNYCDIPKTSFTCANKLIPGVYADVETGCQVFHACWSVRIDSFLCPIGTTFNQALLTCDFWHASDCSSSSQLFDQSQFSEEKPPRTTASTIAMNDETPITSASNLDFSPELDIPENDGSCQSMISKPLQLRMKFVPAKCEVRELKQITPETTSESSKHDGERYNRLADVLSKVLGDALAFIIKAAELGSSDTTRIQGSAKRLKLRMDKESAKPQSRTAGAATEFPSTLGEVDTMSDEQVHHSTELPSENISSWTNPRYVEDSVFKTNSQKVKPRKTLLKPSKLSEESKKHALDVVMKTLEFGGNIMSDVLPFMEKMILDSPIKMSKLKKSRVAVDAE